MTRVRKTILQRKNASKVLELANQGKAVSEIAKETSIWYNRVNFLYKELVDAGYITTDAKDTKVDLNAMLKSNRKDVIVAAFKQSKTVMQSDLTKVLGVKRLPSDMLEDLRALESKKVLKVEKQGAKKVLTLI